MSIHTFFLLLFITVSFNSLLSGQNLLSNGDFESYIQCPDTERPGTSFIEGYLVDWHQTVGGRMHHTDCHVGDSDFWFYADTDSLQSVKGNGITTGLSFLQRRPFLFDNKRDYLMAPLSEPMIADSTYNVSYTIHSLSLIHI